MILHTILTLHSDLATELEFEKSFSCIQETAPLRNRMRQILSLEPPRPFVTNVSGHIAYPTPNHRADG